MKPIRHESIAKFRTRALAKEFCEGHIGWAFRPVRIREEEILDNKAPMTIFTQPKINCPKHGIHGNIITSTIAGHEGYWCQICWLETLGPSLDLVNVQEAK
jgi:hypothetical protein